MAIHAPRGGGPSNSALLVSICFLHVFFAASEARTFAQTRDEREDRPIQHRLALYVDCRGITCNADELHADIPFVDHVRDRHDADVLALVTAEPTGSGGTDATITFMGQQSFAGLDDVLHYVFEPASSGEQIRVGLANVLKRGLVRYVNRTAFADDLRVVYAPVAPVSDSIRDDRWRHWTFAGTVNAVSSGEELVSTANASASISATHVSEAWKINAVVQNNYSRSTFDVAGAQIKSMQRSRAMTTLIARGLNDHLSVGTRISAISSEYLNQSLTVRGAPAVEFNVFSYRESTRRMLTFEYSAGTDDFHYREPTIFSTRAETLFDHRLLTSLALRQPWGAVGLGVEASQYIQHPRTYRAVIAANVDWSVARGLSLSTSANFSQVRDQRFLPSRSASNEEILLRQRQLATSYSYVISFGVSYTFGSPYANIVNRRFSGTVGGMALAQ